MVQFIEKVWMKDDCLFKWYWLLRKDHDRIELIRRKDIVRMKELSRRTATSRFEDFTTLSLHISWALKCSSISNGLNATDENIQLTETLPQKAFYDTQRLRLLLFNFRIVVRMHQLKSEWIQIRNYESKVSESQHLTPQRTAVECRRVTKNFPKENISRGEEIAKSSTKVSNFRHTSD